MEGAEKVKIDGKQKELVQVQWGKSEKDDHFDNKGKRTTSWAATTDIYYINSTDDEIRKKGAGNKKVRFIQLVKRSTTVDGTAFRPETKGSKTGRATLADFAVDGANRKAKKQRNNPTYKVQEPVEKTVGRNLLNVGRKLRDQPGVSDPWTITPFRNKNVVINHEFKT